MERFEVRFVAKTLMTSGRKWLQVQISVQLHMQVYSSLGTDIITVILRIKRRASQSVWTSR